MFARSFRILSRAPLPVLYALTASLDPVLFHALRFRREVVDENLRASFPELDDAARTRIEREFYRGYSDVLAEMIKSLTITPDELLTHIHFQGDELLRSYLDAGRPVLALGAHHANIEWALLACCAHFSYPVEVIYRPTSNSALEEIVRDGRSRFNPVLIPDRGVVRELMARRNTPRIITLVADQSPNVGDDRYWTRFLNQDTAFFRAPEIIARFGNYPAVFLGVRRTARGRYDVTVSKLAEPPFTADNSLLEAYIRAVETQVRADPANWLWLHRRWKHKRPLYDNA